MKLRPFLTFLLAIVLVLISASVVGAVWLSRQSPLRLDDTRISSKPEAALFVSRQAPLMLSLQVNPDRLKAYRLTNTKIGQRAQVQAQFDRWQRRLLGEPKLSYGDDIAPWAGNEMTLALMNPDVDRDVSNGQQPGYLLAVEVADPDRAKASLQKFWRGQAARNQVEEVFEGVELTYADPELHRRSKEEDIELPSLTTAIVSDQFVLFTNYPKVLRQALNNVQVAELSLNADKLYQKAIDQLTDRRIGVAFVNVPQFATWLTAQRPEPTDTRLIAALQPTSQGILAKLNLLSDPNFAPIAKDLLDLSSSAAGQSEPSGSEAKAILKTLPADSAFVLSGVNVGQTWAQIQASDLSWVAPVKEAIDRLQQQWGLDFAHDLFPWMPGDFALALVPRAGNISAGNISRSANPKTPLLQQFDAAFITKRSPETEAGLERLNSIALREGVSSGTFQLGEQEVFAWTKLTPTRARNSLSLEAIVQGLQTQLGNYQVFATSVEAMQQVIDASTAETPATLQKTIAQLEDSVGAGNSRSQIFVNWAAFRSRYGNQPIVQRLEQTVKPLFESLQTIAFTANAADSEREGDRSLGALLLRFQEPE